jgi:hypothetical protein
MNTKRHLISILAMAAFMVTGAGCVSLNPDNFVPKSLTPAGNDQRIDGTVNVQAFVPNGSAGKFHLTDRGGEVLAVLPGAPRGRVALFGSGKLRVALEKAIAQKGLFRRIEQGDADYVLDVWIMDAVRVIQALGEGYVIDVTAIWRLTRVKDGKVIVCILANGHGASHAVGTNAYVESLETATREMVQKGLLLLSDRSKPLAAMYVAGEWPSMGAVVPEGYRKMKENFAKLRKGMKEEDIRKMIPSLPNASCSIAAQGRGDEGVVYEPCGWITYSERELAPGLHQNEVVFEPLLPFYYSMTFVNGVLERWELR